MEQTKKWQATDIAYQFGPKTAAISQAVSVSPTKKVNKFLTHHINPLPYLNQTPLKEKTPYGRTSRRSTNDV
jgi:hypothetical protein